MHTTWILFSVSTICMATRTDIYYLPYREVSKSVGRKVSIGTNSNWKRIHCSLQFSHCSYNADLLIPANAAVIREFGALYQNVSNVIYTNGAIDPWLHTGMQVSLDPNTVVITIDSKNILFKWLNASFFFSILAYAKSADLTSINLGIDTPVLVQAKEKIQSQIIEWSLWFDVVNEICFNKIYNWTKNIFLFYI